MSTITVPNNHWFEYQTWLNQNYMYPIVDYKILPTSFGEIVVTFTKESDMNRFIERWDHTFNK